MNMLLKRTGARMQPHFMPLLILKSSVMFLSMKELDKNYKPLWDLLHSNTTQRTFLLIMSKVFVSLMNAEESG